MNLQRLKIGYGRFQSILDLHCLDLTQEHTMQGEVPAVVVSSFGDHLDTSSTTALFLENLKSVSIFNLVVIGTVGRTQAVAVKGEA